MRDIAGPHSIFENTENGGGQGRNRTTDTRIFNPLLCQLSYLAVERTRIKQEITETVKYYLRHLSQTGHWHRHVKITLFISEQT
jgi:hypothetical protein